MRRPEHRFGLEGAFLTKEATSFLSPIRIDDPQIATLVLQELLSRYFVKHLEVHRSAGAFDFVTQQTDQVRARLNQTEDALKSLQGEDRNCVAQRGLSGPYR